MLAFARQRRARRDGRRADGGDRPGRPARCTGSSSIAWCANALHLALAAIQARHGAARPLQLPVGPHAARGGVHDRRDGRTCRSSGSSSGRSRCWWPPRASCSACTTRPTSLAGALHRRRAGRRLPVGSRSRPEPQHSCHDSARMLGGHSRPPAPWPPTASSSARWRRCATCATGRVAFEIEHAPRGRVARSALPQQRAQPAALPEHPPDRHPRAAAGPALAGAVLARRARGARAGDAERGDRQPRGAGGRARERAPAAAGRFPHRPAAAARPRATPARARAPRPLGAHHGHDAERRGRRRRA